MALRWLARACDSGQCSLNQLVYSRSRSISFATHHPHHHHHHLTSRSQIKKRYQPRRQYSCVPASNRSVPQRSITAGLSNFFCTKSSNNCEGEEQTTTMSSSRDPASDQLNSYKKTVKVSLTHTYFLT